MHVPFIIKLWFIWMMRSIVPKDRSRYIVIKYLCLWLKRWIISSMSSHWIRLWWKPRLFTRQPFRWGGNGYPTSPHRKGYHVKKSLDFRQSGCLIFQEKTYQILYVLNMVNTVFLSLMLMRWIRLGRKSRLFQMVTTSTRWQRISAFTSSI